MNLPFALHRAVDRLPWRVARPVRTVLTPPHGHYCVLWHDPPIVLVPEDFYDDSGTDWRPFFAELADVPVHFLCLVRWGVEQAPGTYAAKVRAEVDRHRGAYPRHRFTFLANNAAQASIYRETGLDFLEVNQNALADESAFEADAHAEKRYDAIYNAVLAPYKRHHLAAQVENLALVTYLQAQHEDYARSVAQALRHAAWLNFPGGRISRDAYVGLSRSQVAGALRQARTGLCLSEIEGAMFASVEYLLCGVPVVTTPSVGGRDEMFRGDYAIWVPPDPRAVKEGVDSMIRRGLTPGYVRARVLEEMRVHRLRLAEFLASRTSARAGRFDFRAHLQRLIAERVYHLRPLHRVRAAIEAARKAALGLALTA